MLLHLDDLVVVSSFKFVSLISQSIVQVEFLSVPDSRSLDEELWRGWSPCSQGPFFAKSSGTKSDCHPPYLVSSSPPGGAGASHTSKQTKKQRTSYLWRTRGNVYKVNKRIFPKSEILADKQVGEAVQQTIGCILKLILLHLVTPVTPSPLSFSPARGVFYNPRVSSFESCTGCFWTADEGDGGQQEDSWTWRPGTRVHGCRLLSLLIWKPTWDSQTNRFIFCNFSFFWHFPFSFASPPWRGLFFPADKYLLM